MTALLLGLIALVLIGPGPLWVARWGFLHRVPRAAVVLWQAGSIAALVSVIGAGAVIVLPLLSRTEGLAALPLVEVVLYGAIVIFTATVVLRLLFSLVTVARTTSVRRRRHRAAVDLLGQIDETSPLPGLRILAQQLPVAYCLPGLRESRVVLSRGTLSALAADELTAVLEHETAHVRARHDLVLDTFNALHRAFPLAVRSEMPAEQCRLLVEMLADDAARRRIGALPLARALVTMAGSPVPTTALGSGSSAAARIERLAAPVRPTRLLATAVYVLALGLVGGPVLLLAAPELLAWVLGAFV